MAFRARKSIKIAKGVRLNVSKSGVGMSTGIKGARYSTHSSGRKTATLGIPGSGLSYVSSSSGGGTKVRASGEMTEAQQRRLVERFEKRKASATEKRNNPIQKLQEKYAAGKITKDEFDRLAVRDKKITLDYVIFGRVAGIKLAERYLQGKIDDEEFEQLRNELLGDPEAERDKIINEFKLKLSEVNSAVAKARADKSDSKCNYCGRAKKFYSPLLKESDFKLCVPCKSKFKSILNYPGYNGEYYIADKAKIIIDKPMGLRMNVVPSHILEYR